MKRDTIWVLTPLGELPTGGVAVPAFPADLRGRIVGFLDNTKANFDRLVGDMAELLRGRFGVRVVIHRKKANAATPASPDLLAELSKQCDVVFAGSAD